MRSGDLGTVYSSGQEIVREGDVGACMYVIQQGQVEVVSGQDGNLQRLALLGEGDFFGEMALFGGEERSATVRAVGDARVLKVDKRTLLRRIQEDPLLALNILEALSDRIRRLNERVTASEGAS
ncbi:MAG TPA: cyclic nucleotide-binding domain-containing protein [Gaiellaceae bacterium]|nr:cyclic nucleotide-binding domain-containing protein [Gaiellaceae bacterium]